MYSNNLSKDKNPKHFDDRVFNFLKEHAKDPKYVQKTKDYLDSIGWNQSKYSSKQMEQQAERFAQPNWPWFGWNTHYKAAKSDLIAEASEFALKSLQYDGNDKIEEYLPREDTHAGWSYIVTGNKEKGKYREGLFQNYKAEESLARKNGTFNKPIIVGTRTQASDPFNDDGSPNNDYRDKTRLVSMVDIYVIMAEVIYAKRLQSKFSTVPWYAGGKNDVQILHYMRKWAAQFKYWLSIDYSKFDQSISNWMIRDAFDVVRAAYSKDPDFDEELFKIVREDFINKVIILGENKLYESEKGVPSGSMFTQIIDSIVNKLMIKTYMYSIGIAEFEMMIMGDDNIIFTNIEIDAKHLSTYLAKNFGIEMHPDKCGGGKCSDEDPEFLSRIWKFEGVYRKPEILIAKLCFPESYRRYDLNPDMHPGMIVECFRISFPLGMTFIKPDVEFTLDEIRKSLGNGRWLTGLMRMKLLYAS